MNYAGILELIAEIVGTLVTAAKALGASDEDIEGAIAKGKSARKAKIAADRKDELSKFPGGEG